MNRRFCGYAPRLPAKAPVRPPIVALARARPPFPLPHADPENQPDGLPKPIIHQLTQKVNQQKNGGVGPRLFAALRRPFFRSIAYPFRLILARL
jgi:hypothetical protein